MNSCESIAFLAKFGDVRWSLVVPQFQKKPATEQLQAAIRDRQRNMSEDLPFVLNIQGSKMSLRNSMKSRAFLAGLVIVATPLSGHAADLEVKVGFAAPLTGQNAGYGKDLENGVKLALNEANTANIKIGDQVAHFTLVSQDDQADPRVGVQVAQKLVDEHVAIVIGHLNSGTTIPASQVYETAGIPMINGAATNPAITGRGFKNVFQTIANDSQNAGYAGAYAVETTKAKRIAILDDRTAFGQGEADEFEKSVKAHGGNIVAHEFTNNTAVDFGSQLTKIKSLNADLVFFGGLDSQAAAVVKKMKQLGMNAQFLAGGGVMDPDFIKLAGDAAEGAQAWEYGRPLTSMQGGRDFSTKYKKVYGIDLLVYAPFGYDATWTGIKAMQAAKSINPSDYREVLRSISFNGVTGPIAFNPDGSLKHGASTHYQVEHGAWVATVSKGGS